MNLIVLFCATSSVSGCQWERSTQVRVDGAVRPSFHLSGSGELASFAIYSPDYITKAQVPFDENFVLWELEPSEGHLKGAHVGEIRDITYGVVPEGYVQVRPQIGSPPPLTEGQRYFYRAETVDAPWGSGFFEMRNSRAVPTDGPGICFGRENNKWICVPCSK